MARGRFISATLGGSRKFARLANDTHRMIYVLLIPSADAYGRVDVDPVTLSGRVLTRLSISPDVVSAALADMHSVGLIHLYDVGEDHYAEITNFHEHNDIDLSREAQGEIPDARGVLPPEKPPRGTKRADADPRVWSGDYLAANAAPTTDRGTPAPTQATRVSPNGRTALARGGHVPHAASQVQSNPSAIRHEVEVEGEVEVKNPPTPLEEPEPPGSEMVEATPRREKPPKSTKPGKNGRALHHEFNPTTIAEELPPNFDPELFQAFCSSRLKLKRPMTTEALRQFLRKHEKRPRNELDEMFRAAIVAGWLDLYPPKPRDARDKPNDTTLDQYTERGL